MTGQLCSEPECSLVAWEACERCHQPFCFVHTRFVPHEVALDPGGRAIEFELVCLDCLPDSADEDAWGDWQRGTGTGTGSAG